MNRNTVALIGGALGAVLGKVLYEKVNPGEVAPVWVPIAGAVAGGAGGYQLATSNVELMQAINNGRRGTGKIGSEAVALLEKINPSDLYRDEVTNQVKIGMVYPNEKTVGTF